MAKELIARGQTTIYTQTDGYTVQLSRQNCVVSTDKEGKVLSGVTVTTVVTALKGTATVTPIIGTLPAVSGCTLSKSGTTVSVTFNTGTSLAENGTVDIPVTVDGQPFTLSFAYAKARQGNTGVSGTDANLLDWVSDWDTGKTIIGSNSVITPKIFAGIKNSNGTLTGLALGRFPLTVINTDGTTGTETVDGIYGFKDGNKTFFVDNGGNAQLGRGNQYIKFNASTGKVEFGSEVSLNWIGATYIDASGIFTGTLSAGTVNAINFNASQITAGTINASRIDVDSLKASLITASNIEALTLSVIKGTIGGWTIDADSIFKGTKNNTAGAYTGASGAMTIGSAGIRGRKWRLDATGAGALAGGNIVWDASGNVTFASSVSLNWSMPIDSITTALGGSSFPKLTQIDAGGIYTGTLSASQVRVDSTLVVGGSAYNGSIAVRDASNSTKVTLNRTGITAVGGTIGGWTIASNQISKNSVILSSDGSITNGTKWKLNNDGSGQFAGGNISWTATGTVTITGTVNASAGTIGGFEIGSGRIGSTASSSGAGGGLAIYNDLFRVGSSTSYVLFGDDTFPASAGGAFTSTGRITNNKSNSGYTNCGIYISVSGGTKNFGVHSNAVIMAPAVIGNKVKTLAFSGSGYSLDFSQHNVFFIYGTANYSVTLPAESQVASMFSLSSLPSDFGFIFTLVYNYNYGNQLTVNGIKNNNGATVNCAMACGDSLTILCAKFPSFHYQVINHYS